MDGVQVNVVLPAIVFVDPVGHPHAGLQPPQVNVNLPAGAGLPPPQVGVNLPAVVYVDPVGHPHAGLPPLAPLPPPPPPAPPAPPPPPTHYTPEEADEIEGYLDLPIRNEYGHMDYSRMRLEDRIRDYNASGRGKYGHQGCLLELRPSSALHGGQGLWIRDRAIIWPGQIVTTYNGHVRTGEQIPALTALESLHSIEVSRVGRGRVLVSNRQLTTQHGLGQFINSAVSGVLPSNVVSAIYRNNVYYIALGKIDYPLYGLTELFVSAYNGWWKNYNPHTFH